MSDTQMLNWVAKYVTEINTLDAKGKFVEVVCADQDKLVVIKRRGKNTVAAFRKCIEEAMKQLP